MCDPLGVLQDLLGPPFPRKTDGANSSALDESEGDIDFGGISLQDFVQQRSDEIGVANAEITAKKLSGCMLSS